MTKNILILLTLVFNLFNLSHADESNNSKDYLGLNIRFSLLSFPAIEASYRLSENIAINAGVMHSIHNGEKYYLIPLTASFFIQKSLETPHKFELLAGILSMIKEDETLTAGTSGVFYNYLPLQGISFRSGLMLLYANSNIRPAIEVNFGYSF